MSYLERTGDDWQDYLTLRRCGNYIRSKKKRSLPKSFLPLLDHFSVFRHFRYALLSPIDTGMSFRSVWASSPQFRFMEYRRRAVVSIMCNIHRTRLSRTIHFAVIIALACFIQLNWHAIIIISMIPLFNLLSCIFYHCCILLRSFLRRLSRLDATNSILLYHTLRI